MTQRNNLYRRPSGIYVLRITVPACYRSQLGQREIHASTRTTDLCTAKAVALHLLAQWQSCMSELSQVNEKKVIDGSPLLAGAGLISIQDFCDAFEVSVKLVLNEVLNNNIHIACRLNVEPLFWVEDFTLIEREEDTGGFVLDNALELGIPRTFTGYLRPFHRSHTITNIIESGHSDETSFRSKPNTLTAAFCNLPGIRITASSIFITKVQAERIRAPWVKALKGKKLSLEATAAAPASVALVTNKASSSLKSINSASSIFESRFCTPRFANMLSSELLSIFLNHKSPTWGLDQKDAMTSHCALFVELMKDPKLGVIDREFIREYEANLKRVPAKRNIASQRHKTNDIAKLIELADKHDEKRLSEQSLEKYLGMLSQFFRWAVTEDYFIKNPAEKIFQKTQQAKRRAQDSRDRFDQSDLNTIFSVDWFATGGATRNKSGGLASFRPYYYWLPLFGLYTGARLNEISQLYLHDITEYEPGKAYISINNETPESNKKNPTKAPDKSIKNDNSKRVIPIHHKLIALGFLNYIQALRANGETRLFPELIYDEKKGYGKAAGRWFNEHFLGKRLNLERDGMKTFHSFRHTLITKLNDIGTPELIISAIAGHERGQTTSLKLYNKDNAARLYPYINRVSFDLPIIQPFKVPEGIAAIRQALHRRKIRPH